MKALYFYQTALGRFGIAEESGCITALHFASKKPAPEAEIRETPLLKEAAAQLDAYLSRRLKEFSLPLLTAGTPFMQKVWEELRKIPYGQTASYKEIAQRIGHPQAQRAVGMANNRNPIPIFIPCHRVIGADGSLVGFGGGLELKRQLLDIEK
ncbi:MAG: methylated-DNA--[protein]-cysteine S-methyltransferase [Clostridiales bacterium]|nr:methylated-DNA--[protein]-cysteine S-methyltransferase [Clostridiales bacterium]